MLGSSPTREFHIGNVILIAPDIDGDVALTKIFKVFSDPDLPFGEKAELHGASYRIEIAIDERPWTGETPWLRHAVEYALPLRGKETALPYLEGRWAFYGRKPSYGWDREEGDYVFWPCPTDEQAASTSQPISQPGPTSKP